MSGMAQSTSDSILGVIRQESWILDHFEIFVTIVNVRYSESPLFPLTLNLTLTDPNLNPNPKTKHNPSTVARICTMDFWNSRPSE